MKAWIFCNPGDIYFGKEEKVVSDQYTEMAIKEYDKMIKFEKEYDKYKEYPDYVRKVGEKENRNLNLTLFYEQPIVRINEMEIEVLSSSYLFNPESKTKKDLLPDLDIVEFSGEKNDVEQATKEVMKFYQRHGWKTNIFYGDFNKSILVDPQTDRFPEKISIVDPDFLRTIASEYFGYNPKRLYFKSG